MKSSLVKFIAMSLVIGAPYSLALAQSDSADDGALEEITVTSRRYAESLQDVPVAVNVMTDQYIEDQGIDDVSDVLNFSPGGSFTQFNKMQAEYGLRGVSRLLITSTVLHLVQC